MSYEIPNNTRLYLESALSSRITNSPKEDCFEYWINESIMDTLKGKTKKDSKKKEDPAKTVTPESLKASTSGGYGSGGGSTAGVKYPKTRDVEDTLLGDEKNRDGFGLGTVAGLYAAGAGAGMLGDFLGVKLGKKAKEKAASGGFLGALGSKAFGKAGSLVSQLGGQVETLLGKDWVDANIANIAQNQMQLAAQGAGSPWVPLAGKVKKK